MNSPEKYVFKQSDTKQEKLNAFRRSIEDPINQLNERKSLTLQTFHWRYLCALNVTYNCGLKYVVLEFYMKFVVLFVAEICCFRDILCECIGVSVFLVSICYSVNAFHNSHFSFESLIVGQRNWIDYILTLSASNKVSGKEIRVGGEGRGGLGRRMFTLGV